MTAYDHSHLSDGLRAFGTSLPSRAVSGSEFFATLEKHGVTPVLDERTVNGWKVPNYSHPAVLVGDAELIHHGLDKCDSMLKYKLCIRNDVELWAEPYLVTAGYDSFSWSCHSQWSQEFFGSLDAAPFLVTEEAVIRLPVPKWIVKEDNFGHKGKYALKSEAVNLVDSYIKCLSTLLSEERDGVG